MVGRWKNGRIENDGMIEKWEDENILISPISVWLRVEKWKDGKSEFV